MADKCAWCGRPIEENQRRWTETGGGKIHTSCMDFLWKIAYASKEYVSLAQEIAEHFQKIGE
jgi:hypothetical protein